MANILRNRLSKNLAYFKKAIKEKENRSTKMKRLFEISQHHVLFITRRGFSKYKLNVHHLQRDDELKEVQEKCQSQLVIVKYRLLLLEK